MKVRIKFAKYGSLRFIGHLDVMRFFQKTIRRAGIDVAYSSGYSPHQIMSFASPLGIGMCSYGEYMDVELLSHRGSADLKERLQKECVEGLDIISARLLPEGAKNAMASVAAASYSIAFKEDGSFDDYAGQSEAFLAQRCINITKKTKRSTAQLDIRPGIYEFAIKNGCLDFTVDASSSGNIRPSFVTESFLEFAGVSVPETKLMVTRTETWMNTGADGEFRLAPLEAAGEEF